MMMPKIVGFAAARGRYFAGLSLFLLASALFAFGQDATIVGTVTDSSGAAVPNVAITVTNVETGTSRSSITNDTGQYVIPSLKIGHYNIGAKAAGFGGEEKNGVLLEVGDRARIDFTLKVGAAQEQITVEANAVAVQTDTGEVSNVITGNQLTQLATNSRSIYTLVNLTPGVANIQGDSIAPTSITGDQNVSIN
ncbi:MAG: carboxypeptidase-like regulatory domain-containing protein, partial [Terriglobales bacterium]